MSIQLLGPGDQDYANLVEIFNSARSRDPLFAVCPSDVFEVREALRVAHENDFRVSIRGGGHGISGRAIRGDLVLDMRAFRKIEVLRDSVSVGAGLTWSELDRTLSGSRLVVPGGTVSSTGIAGLTLGGGVGWLLPSHGLTSDHLISVSGVTASGEFIRVSDGGDDGWLMPWFRGMGHGLMAVTQFEFDRMELPNSFRGGSVTYSMDAARSVLPQLVKSSHECPKYMNWSPSLLHDGEQFVLSVDGGSHGEVGIDEWLRMISPVRPMRSDVRDMSYVELQSMLDNPRRWGQRSTWRSVYVSELPPSVLDLVVESINYAPTTDCLVFIERFAGAVEQELRPSRFPLRDATFNVLFAASWDSAADDRALEAWAATAAERVRDQSGRRAFHHTYANYASDCEIITPPEMARQFGLVIEKLDASGIFSSCRRD